MNEMEVWLLDDELEHSACEEVRSYAKQKIDGVLIRQARDIAEFKNRVSDYLADESRAFVLAFIDHWGTGKSKMAVPALVHLQEQLGPERSMAILMSDLDKPEQSLDSGELFRNWVDKGGHAYVAKKDITDPFLGEYYLAINLALAFKMAALWQEAEKLRERELRRRENEKAQTQMIGVSAGLAQIKDLIPTVADSDASVLIYGESGTGKDLIPTAIHYASQRADGPFVAINCAAIPATLIESELFGYEKGAFTDAKARKRGLLEQAQGGTLFLDEIGELEIALQAKLLRVLETHEFRRVGGLEDISLDVRVIAASNRVLKGETDAVRFRQDLYYRLAVVPIDVPPLRDRTEDLPYLVQHFLERLIGVKGRRMSPEAIQILRSYAWPGNIRELRNVVWRMALLAGKELIGVEDIPQDIRASKLRGVGRTDNDWADLRKMVSSRHPEGKCELVDKRMRKRIKMEEDEIKRAKAEGKSLDIVRIEVYKDLLVHIIEETYGDILTITDILRKDEKTIREAFSDFGIDVQQKGGQFVIANRTAA